MRNDRELLKLAAKAAGLEEFQYINGEPAYRFQRTGLQDWKRWNPLTDDGDALRLLVRLSLNVMLSFDAPGMNVALVQYDGGLVREPAGADPYAATRRAIVLAAAEMGSRL